VPIFYFTPGDFVALMNVISRPATLQHSALKIFDFYQANGVCIKNFNIAWHDKIV
jgi:hypothetical protein